MKNFFDCEFLEDGLSINLISIAFVAEDGREYYAVNADADWDRITKDPWLQKNVVQQLPDDETQWKRKELIAKEVLAFLTEPGDPIDLFAWFSAYDHVSYAQLFGKMIDLPKGLPMYTHDVRSLLDWALPKSDHADLPRQPAGMHDALADARHLKTRYDWIMRVKAYNDTLPGPSLTLEELEALPVESVVRFKYSGTVGVKGKLGDWQVAGRSTNYLSPALAKSKEGVHLIWKPLGLTARSAL